MVRRLIQQQQLRLQQQQFAQGGACLLATAQMRGGRGLLLAAKAQAIQHLPHTLLQRIAARVLEARLQFGVAIKDGVVCVGVGQRVGITHAGGQVGHLTLPGVDVLQRCQHFFVEGMVGHKFRYLWQIADQRALRIGNLAAVWIQPSGKHIEERCFARAVGANEANAVARVDAERDALQDQLGAI